MSEITIEIVASGAVAARLPDAEAGAPRLLTLRAGESVADVLEAFGLSAQPLLVILGERVVVPEARATTWPVAGERLVLAPPIRAG